jgi:hypothetical protein
MKYSIKAAAAAVGVAAGAALAALPMTGAVASTGVSVSFAASQDSSAAFAAGSNHPDAVLMVGNCPTTVSGCQYGGWAQISLNGVNGDLPTTAPGLSVTHYAAGTPRLEIVPANGGDSLATDATGYPDPSLCANPTNGICWALPSSPNTYTATWSAVQTFINGEGGAKTAYVVADASQAVPYTSDVTSLSWNGQALIPGTVANQLTAKDTCGSYANRHWTVTSVAGTGVTFFVKTRLNSGRWYSLGHAESVAAEGSVSFVTTRGTTLKLGYPNGLGQFVHSEFPSYVSSC